MNNTTRDRTKEGLDPDNPGLEVVPPPEIPVPNDSARVPGGATEIGELERALEPPMGGAGRSNKAP
jgi:hypothetical protein